jgi:leucyl-tRNA synthetase
LPTENYAIKVGKPAHEVTQDNINNFLRQINALDLSFDMERTVVTSDPSYYQWTQWLFHELFDAGLIYRDEQFVNRCPGCQTVIANDQVTEGTCERCKATIEQKLMPQWFVKTTAYADELIQ